MKNLRLRLITSCILIPFSICVLLLGGIYLSFFSLIILFVGIYEILKVFKDFKSKIIKAIKSKCSPRHSPNLIFSISQVPYTISGKKMEIPIKKILSGEKIENVVSKGAMKNPECIDDFLVKKIN